MNPINHILAGWAVANADAALNKRERLLITAAGIFPDADGLGIVIELATRNSSHPLPWYSQYHRMMFHNVFAAVVLSVIGFLLATRRWKTATLVFLSYHLHLLGDLVSGKGPDGSIWGVPYLAPFSKTLEVSWAGQWELNAWPNVLFVVTMLALTFVLAWRRGYSPLEMVSLRADQAFVRTLRERFSF